MNRKSSSIEVISLQTECIEKLRIDHSYKEIEGLVGIRHDQKQCLFPVAQRIQSELIVFRNLPNCVNIEPR